MTEYDTARPYTSSYLIVREAGKIGFVLRSNTAWMNGYYSLPSGKVEKQETFTEAAAREGLEEIGIIVSPENLKPAHTMHRVNDGEKGEWVDVFFEVQAYENEPYNAEPGVHGEFVWLDPPETSRKYHAIYQTCSGTNRKRLFL